MKKKTIKEEDREYFCATCGEIVGYVKGIGRGMTIFYEGVYNIGFDYYCSNECFRKNDN